MNIDPFLAKFYCRHLQEYGTCRFGVRCLFSHSKKAYKVPDNVCFYNLKKSCCKLDCSAAELITQLRLIFSYSNHHNDEDDDDDEPSTSRNTKNRILKTTIESDVEERFCGICLESVTYRKRFGLLSNCDHIFCLNCIMTWRKSSTTEADTRNCPECRTPTSYVVPSRYYASGDERRRIVEQYKEERRTVLCKFERNGKNNCRKQGNCLFRHTLPFNPQLIFERRPLNRNDLYYIDTSLIVNTYLFDSSDDASF